MVAEAQGAKSRLYAKDGAGVADWTTGTIRSFPFYRSTMRKVGSVVHPQVITGTRSEHAERARNGPSIYYGQLVLEVSPSQMAFWAPYYMGGTPSGTNYPLGNTLNPFSLYIDEVTTKYAYYDCYIDKALVIGKQNGPGGQPNYLTLALTCYALSYTNAPATAASAAIPSITGDYVPLIFEDTASAITIKGAARETKQFAILHNNFLKPRYTNNIEPSLLYPLHRQVTLQTRHPFDSGTSALDDVALASSAVGAITATNGSVSVKWDFIGLLQLIPQSPVVTGKTEIDLTQRFAARMNGATLEYQLVIDNTP